jgi:hypothetical protein
MKLDSPSKTLCVKLVSTVFVSLTTLFLLPRDSLGLLLSVFVIATALIYIGFLIAMYFLEDRIATQKALVQTERNLIDFLTDLGDWTTDEALERIRRSHNVKILKEAVKTKWKRKALQPFTINLLDSL